MLFQKMLNMFYVTVTNVFLLSQCITLQNCPLAVASLYNHSGVE